MATYFMDDLSTRQQQIMTLIHQQEYCSIEELAQQFEITPQTIRRDINLLCQQGIAMRHHGGVGLPVTLSNRSYDVRQITNKDEKHEIAKNVAKAIPNGCTLFLGIGTTIACIAEQLVSHRELRVVTNNFQAAHTLSKFENIETWIPSGRIRANGGDIVDDTVLNYFSQFAADIGIIGCAGISELPHASPQTTYSAGKKQAFAMEHELREARVSQAILDNSQQTWLVANHTKWQRKASTKVAPLCQFDRVFSNNIKDN